MTASVFRRYDITSTSDLKDAMGKLAVAGEAPQGRTVLPMQAAGAR